MKINNDITSFKAGLTYSMRREIGLIDISRVSTELSGKGIDTDFKQNPIICWASKKCVEFVEELNHRFGIDFGLPNGIYAEDFRKLNIKRKNSAGFCNLAPTNLYLDKEIIVPEKTIFFNTCEGDTYWKNINEISDKNYQTGISTTDFFLETFLHEFAHIIHAENLINTLGGEKFVNLIRDSVSESNLKLYRTKYQQILETICGYAEENPMEAVSCDLSSRMISNIDKSSLRPTNNFVKNSPYARNSFWQYLFRFDKKDKMLERFWKGNFD